MILHRMHRQFNCRLIAFEKLDMDRVPLAYYTRRIAVVQLAKIKIELFAKN